MQKFVLDASIAVKWFSDEGDTDKAERLLAQTYERRVALSAPHLIIYEVANALWKGKRFEETKITASVNTLLESPIEFAFMDASLAQTAVSFMTRYNLTFYDAAYAALASLLGVPLLSANPKDHAKIKEITVTSLTQLK